jgi:hypothetical protein
VISKINLVLGVALGVVIVTTLAFVVYTRFTNIDMTETRLFVTYWKEYIVLACLCVTLAFGFKRTE